MFERFLTASIMRRDNVFLGKQLAREIEAEFKGFIERSFDRFTKAEIHQIFYNRLEEIASKGGQISETNVTTWPHRTNYEVEITFTYKDIFIVLAFAWDPKEKVFVDIDPREWIGKKAVYASSM